MVMVLFTCFCLMKNLIDWTDQNEYKERSGERTKYPHNQRTELDTEDQSNRGENVQFDSRLLLNLCIT